MQVIAQQLHAQPVLFRQLIEREFIQLREPLLQMSAALVASLLRNIRPPVVVLMTPNRRSKFRFVLQPFFKVRRKPLGKIPGRIGRSSLRRQRRSQQTHHQSNQQSVTEFHSLPQPSSYQTSRPQAPPIITATHYGVPSAICNLTSAFPP